MLTWTSRALLLVAAGAMSLAPLRADDRTATVTFETGQVSLFQDGRALQALSVGSAIHRHELIVTGQDSYAKFQLTDGSTFEVFADSKVTFDYVPGFTDFLNLMIGRIKVFIDHSRGPNYKSVSTPTAVISVRGTVFDVVVEDADGTTFVTVDEGLVTVRNMTAPGSAVPLHPGESVRVFRNQQLAARQIDPNSVFRGVVKAFQQALYQALGNPRPPGGVGGIGGIGGGGTPGTGPATGGQGDKGKPNPPPKPGGQ